MYRQALCELAKIREGRNEHALARDQTPSTLCNEELLRSGKRFNLFNYQCGRPTALKYFSAGGDFLPGEGEQLVILSTGWRSVGDWPINVAFVRQNHERRTGLRRSEEHTSELQSH